MDDPQARFYFDFVDPLSYLVATTLERMGREAGPGIEWHPFELRPPPMPLVGIDHPPIAARWSTARSEAPDVPFAPPTLVPWTRKAHELVAHAAELAAEGEGGSERGEQTHDLPSRLRTRIFRAYHLEGRDIGRVDVLVEIAVELGLDRTNTKAVLDVDRHEAAVASMRRAAEDEGVSDTPTIIRGDARLEGFHEGPALGTLLGTRDPRST